MCSEEEKDSSTEEELEDTEERYIQYSISGIGPGFQSRPVLGRLGSGNLFPGAGSGSSSDSGSSVHIF